MRASSRPLLLALTVAASAWIPAAASAATTHMTLAGPSTDVSDGSIGTANQPSVGVAADGGGAVAYRQVVGGQPHVFVREYAGGTWTAPVRVDSALTVPAGLPSVAASNGGHVVVVFPSGAAGAQALVAAVKPSSTSGWGAAAQIAAGAPGLNWAGAHVALGTSGRGYVVAVRNADIFAQRIDGTSFTPVGASNLDADPAEMNEAGDQHGPQIAVDSVGDVGTLAWSETHGVGKSRVWARRLTGTTAGSAVNMQVATLFGHTGDENANDDVSVAMGGGTAWIAFHGSFDVGGGASRAHGIVRTFDGTTPGPVQRIDDIADGPGQTPTNNAEFPRIAVNAAGVGLGMSYRGLDPEGATASKLTGGTWSAAAPISADAETGAARGTAAVDSTGAGAVAFYNTIAPGQTQIIGRVYGGTDDGKITTLSDPTLGAAGTATESGAGGGHFITAFEQQTATNTSIVAAVIDLPVPVVPTPTPTPIPTPTPTPTFCSTNFAACASGAPNPTPTLTALTLTTKNVARGTALPALVAPTSPKRTLKFVLDRAANVTFRISKVTTGRTVGGKCLAETKKNRKATKCTRYALQPGKAVIKGVAGTDSVAFVGTVTKGRLAAIGKYRLELTVDGSSTPATALYTLTAAKKTTKTK